MSLRRHGRGRVSLAALALLASFAAGCGGSDDGGGSAAATTQAATQAGNTRLSAAAWADYVALSAELASVNQAATKTFAVCRRLAAPSSKADPDKVKACLAGTTDKVVATGKKAQPVLEEATAEAQGACATAATDLQGAVRLYLASVQALGSTVDSGNLPGSTTQIDNSQEALKNARSAQATFEQACKPA